MASVGHGTGPPSTGPAGPEIGSKEERRKRKKILEVASLFRSYKKRPSTDGARPADDVDDVGGGSASPLMLTDVGASPTPAAQPPLPPPPPSVEVKRKAPIKERGEKMLHRQVPFNLYGYPLVKRSPMHLSRWITCEMVAS